MSLGRTLAELRREADVPVVFVDQRGVITSVNAAFETEFGWSQQEIFGRPLTTIIPKSLHQVHRMGFSRFLDTGVPTLLNRPIRLKAVAKDGRIFEAEHCIIAERHGDEWIFGATIQAIEQAPT